MTVPDQAGRPSPEARAASGRGPEAPSQPRTPSPSSSPASGLVSGPLPAPDLDAATVAARAFLEALGMDLSQPGLDRTPARMAQAFAEMFHPRPFEMTTFANDEGYDEMVVARDIPFTSVCEHHLLPFSGTATVGYLPGDRILGLSKLARVVELFAKRPQVQERMTQQIARYLDEHLAPRGVGVVLSAEHSCMTVRGVQAYGSSTTTSALLGRVREDVRTRTEFLALTGH